MKKADIGLIGLAVMGENLALNMESKGFKVAVYNRSEEKVDAFCSGRGFGKAFIPCHSLKELAENLESPRKVLIMVKAGPAVDELIEQLLPYMDEGDVLIDGGNSHFTDTIRRTKLLEEKKLRYVGVGVSGGEEGALNGPSMMPGGSKEAWPLIKNVFQTICAHVNDGYACCQWIGPDGSGHYVKMIHNGIEYGDMQMICEAYQLMRVGLGMNPDEMRDVFFQWNESELNSYLVKITADILGYKDENGRIVLDDILDTAGQKGTGKWSVVSSLDESVPFTTISEAVYARCLSAMKAERLEASKHYPRIVDANTADREHMIEAIGETLHMSKIITYAQGFAVLRVASDKYGWNLNYSEIAQMWQGGCIIRSSLLSRISAAFEKNPRLSNLLLSEYFEKTVKAALPYFREVVCFAVKNGLAIPALASALEYFDGYTSAMCPANLLQAQRDYFGAHTYERIDSERGVFFHTNWTGYGGCTHAGTYCV